MAFTSQRRKVLIFGDDPSIRNLLYILVERLERDKVAGKNGQPALLTISRNQFDGVLLDMRCSSREPEDGVRGLREIRPSLMGRVLVITAEVSDMKTMELIERHFLLRPSQSRLLRDVFSRLRMLFHHAPTSGRDEAELPEVGKMVAEMTEPHLRQKVATAR